MTETTSIKDEVHRLAERLPVNATWDDVLYEVYVRQSIEAGLEDNRQGRLVTTEQVLRRLGLEQPTPIS